MKLIRLFSSTLIFVFFWTGEPITSFKWDWKKLFFFCWFVGNSVKVSCAPLTSTFKLNQLISCFIQDVTPAFQGAKLTNADMDDAELVYWAAVEDLKISQGVVKETDLTSALWSSIEKYMGCEFLILQCYRVVKYFFVATFLKSKCEKTVKK